MSLVSCLVKKFHFDLKTNAWTCYFFTNILPIIGKGDGNESLLGFQTKR